MANVMDWMDDPSETRGIHFHRNGSWEFTTYREIGDHARRIANHLRGQGVHEGVVSLLVEDSQAFTGAFLGTLHAGLTPAPIASPLTFASHDSFTDHAAAILRAAEPAAVLADTRLAGVAEAAAVKAQAPAPLVLPARAELPDPENDRRTAELALLQFTSGSSGTPKGVCVSADNLIANVRANLDWLGVTPEDSCSSWLPLYHDMGLIGTFLSSVVAQADLWLMTPYDFIAAPVRWLECHGREGVTITAAPNFGYAYAAGRVREEELAGTDFSTWRVAMSGAERVDAAIVAKFSERLAPYGFRASTFSPCYGMAESTLAVSGVAPGATASIVCIENGPRTGEPVTVLDYGRLGVDRPDSPADWLSSCGKPVTGMHVEIIDDDGNPVADGRYGEIRVTGTSVAQGYRGATTGSSTFTPEGLRTGDAGFLLDGELYVIGRLGDSLKVRGRKVHAEDLEAALVQIEGVRAGRCAVALGSRDGRDRAVVVVESDDSAWLPAVSTLLRTRLDASVETIILRAERGAVPRTSSGKPRRRVLWQQIGDGEFPGEVVAGKQTTTPTTERAS
ncbi:AMP-binding protein [Nocardia macrotermitis]|uniref:Long-chain-fatty-acid--AMP ligase FadD26 n=1 Tax=Nocardia macrotermitis TaxID=2585198 RepID=A0A7K0DCK0_9NOCA|nr:AMP-binding protein [Nocardia macrotermitis]MQY22604.1 Long-chain-fatty-acid--AMP ligase FadD26 [Nocardia macrotermitis]